MQGTVKRYSISNHGRLRRNAYSKRNSLGYVRYLQTQLLEPQPRTDNREGLWAKLRAPDGRLRQVNIGRLVATHFLYVPVGNPELHYINSNKEDCHLANLEWIR